MTRLSSSKINELITHLPPRRVITVDWLKSQGISTKLCWWYVHSGWLERVGERAYKKAGEEITWLGAISALQEQLNLPVHVGGKTALQLLGQAHFVTMKDFKVVTLFSPPMLHLPSWLDDKNWETSFRIYKSALLEHPDFRDSLVKRPIDGIELLISCPERAILELLFLVPQHESFEEAVLIMENLGFLRAKVVQSLLEKCASVKVKRLFLHLAEKNRHQWLAEIDQSKISLGSGKRMIGVGGDYDSKYQLSVPKMKDSEEDVFTDIP